MNIKKLFAVLAGGAMLAAQWVAPVEVIAANDELQSAYDWAYENGITTMPTIEAANMGGEITRAQMAKMLANYAKEFTDKKMDTSTDCDSRFTDVASVKGDLSVAIVEACQFGIMGQGITAFRPYDSITRAEFGTALSRLLWGDENEGGTPYYANHLKALQAAGIMTKIDNATARNEIRGYVMIMLQRAAELTEEEDVCDDPLVMSACVLDDESCPAQCREDDEDNKADEDNEDVVLAGNLAVTASANNGSIIIGVPSDTDALTFKTSEEVEISKITLKRYGYSASTDIANVWLENEDGLVISNKKQPNSKGLVTLTIDKDYRSVDGILNATIIVQTITPFSKQGATIGFKVTEVESTAEDVELPKKDPATYSVIDYDGSIIAASTRGGSKVYNYAEGESYEVAKFKVKAADDSAILINGFTLNDVAPTPNISKLGDVIDSVSVTIDDVEVKGLNFSTDKRKLTVSFKDVEIEAKQTANIALNLKLKDFENDFGASINFTLSDSDINAIESANKVRVSIKDPDGSILGGDYDSNGTDDGYLILQTNQFKGGKIKYTNTKLAKVEAAAGANDIVIAEGSIEIPEAINATFTVTVPTAGIIEEMRMYVAGEEFDGTLNSDGKSFDFDVELTKSGKVQFKVDIDEDADKGTKVSLGSIALSSFTMEYDSNGDDPTSVGDVAGSISFADLTVNEAKAALENDADDTVEYIVKETNRKVVFDGKYTAKKADIYLNEFTITGAPAIRAGEAITFYLYLDGEEVADIDVLDTPESFSKVKVEAGKAISVKVEAEVDAASTVTSSNYVFTLALDGVDVDDLPVTQATAGLVEMAVVEKGSVSVSAASSKATVLLRKANSNIAEFTVKPDKGNDVYLESLGFTLVNGSTNLTADDVNVKLDGVAEDGENRYADNFDATANYVVNDLVVYNGILYKTITAHDATAWDPADFTDLTFDATANYVVNDLVVYNGTLYKTSTAHDATAWNGADFTVEPTRIVFDLAEELDSDGVTVEITLKNKTTGIVTLDVDDVNGKDPNKSFTKRFENALVRVSNQRDNEGSTTFILGVSKAESSDEITRVCLYYGSNANEKCVTSVSDGNDDLEWTNPGTSQLMIDAIAYEINGTATSPTKPCAWDGTSADTDGVAGYDGGGTCVVVTKNSYNEFFKVGDTYAKIFKVD